MIRDKRAQGELGVAFGSHVFARTGIKRVLAGVVVFAILVPLISISQIDAQASQVSHRQFEKINGHVTTPPPIANAGGDQSVSDGSSVTLDGSGSQPGSSSDTPLSYMWKLTSYTGPQIYLSATNVVDPTFFAGGPGLYTFSLEVTDTLGQSSTASTTVTVTQGPPQQIDSQGSSAFLGGPSSMTGVFSYPGADDTFTASVSWGDGTSSSVASISFSSGHGSFACDHIYSSLGTYKAVVTIVSGSGAQASQTSTETVNPQIAMWASSTSTSAISWNGADANVGGLVHSNSDISITGIDNTFSGPVQYGGSLNQGLSLFTKFSQTPTKVPSSPSPVSFDLNSILAAQPYSDETNTGCKNILDTWTALISSLSPGVYYAPCNVVLIGDDTSNSLTIVSNSTINLLAGGAHLSPYVDGLLFGTSSSDQSNAINIGSADENLAGFLYAPSGQINIGGLAETFSCGVIANTILVGGADFTISGSSCRQISSAPQLIGFSPVADVSLGESATIVQPSDVITYTASISNASVLGSFSGTLGGLNSGPSTVTATGYDFALQYESSGASSWTTLGSQSDFEANPTTTVGSTSLTLGATGTPNQMTNSIIGAQIASGSSLYWAFVLQTDLSVSQVSQLESTGVQVRILDTVTYSSPASVVPLVSQPQNLTGQLSNSLTSLTNLNVTVLTPAGLDYITPADQPDLAQIALGSSVTVTQKAQVPPISAIGAEESTAQYLQRLQSFNNENFAIQAQVTSQGGSISQVSNVVFEALHLPIVQMSIQGPPSTQSGTAVNYSLILANIGSQTATIASPSVTIENKPATVTGLPTTLSSGASTTGQITWPVPFNTSTLSIVVNSTLSWSDFNFDDYGPTSASYATQVLPNSVEIPPGPPTNVSVTTPGIGNFDVSWDPPNFSGSAPLSSYTVTASPATSLSPSKDKFPSSRRITNTKEFQRQLKVRLGSLPKSAPAGTNLCLYPFVSSCAVPWPVNPNPSTLPPAIDPPSQWLLASESNTPNTILIGGDCPSASVCISVGGTEVSPVSAGSGQVVPLIDVTSDGGAYWVETIPAIASGLSAEYFYSVSCATQLVCMAVGTGTTTSNLLVPVVDRTTDGGGSWQPITLSTSPSSGSLYGISCLNNPGQLSTSTCIATGTLYGSSQSPLLLESTDQGQSWFQVSTPASNYIGSYQEITCVSSVQCMAVGTIASPPSPGSGYEASVLITSDGGTTWSLYQIAQATQSGGGQTVPFLDAISCSTTTTCIAGGVDESFSSTGSISNETPVAYYSTNSGQSWVNESLPDTWPPGSFATVFGATCIESSSGPCYVSGYSWASNGSGLTGPLLDMSSNAGQSWQGLVIPNAPTSLLFGFTGVTCNLDSLCFASGALYSTSSGTFYDVIAMSGPACGTTSIQSAIRVNSGGRPIKGHLANSVSVVISGSPPPTFAQLTGLAPGTSYVISIIATSLVGNSCPAQIGHIATGGLSTNSAPDSITTYDFPDPDVVSSPGFGSQFAFATHQILGNPGIQSVPLTQNANGTWAPFLGSFPLATVGAPLWVDTNDTPPATGGLDAPGVFYYDNQWVMFFDVHNLLGISSQDDCIGVATASSINGPYSYVGTDPLICFDGVLNYPNWAVGGYSSFSQEGSASNFGAIDPQPFVDPATGIAYLLFKTGNYSGTAKLWAWQLDSTGTALVSGSAPTSLLTQGAGDSNTIEAPDMVFYDGQYYLFYAYGNFQTLYTNPVSTQDYRENYVMCPSGPTGSCGPISSTLIGPSTTSAPYGPGSGSLFMDSASTWWFGYSAWNNSCASYSATCNPNITSAITTYRGLFASTVSGFAPPLVSITPVGGSCTGGGYWEVDRSGDVYGYGCATYYGGTDQINPNLPPGGTNASMLPITAVSSASTGDGKGYWIAGSNGLIFSFGDAEFYGPSSAPILNKPIVAMAGVSNTGYWEVASDGGVFAYGSAGFYGSLGASNLVAPIVGMSPTPDDKGYWLVDSRGDIYAFGDAGYLGSSGCINPVNTCGGSNSFTPSGPIVAMASTADGKGYWMVDAGGDIYSFGDAQYEGGEGGAPLIAPIFGIAPTSDGKGYWLGTNDVGNYSKGELVAYPFGDATSESGALPSIRHLQMLGRVSQTFKNVTNQNHFSLSRRTVFIRPPHGRN